MPSKTNISTKPAAKICDGSIKYANLKVDGAIAADNVCNTQQAPVSESSHEHAHPLQADDGSRAPATWVGKEGAIMTDENNTSDLDNAAALNEALGMALETAPKKTLKVDVEKYQAWLDDPALSEEQKGQILEALWKIVLCFVDLGFGVSPLQDACGQLTESEGFCGEEEQDVVSSGASTLSNTFNKIAAE